MHYIGNVVAVLIKSLPKLVKFMNPEYLCTGSNRITCTSRTDALYIVVTYDISKHTLQTHISDTSR